MTSILSDRNFERVGGLQEHIQTLKEMIIYPLLYRELFDSYGIQAPRGVLFYGPPGTGKTLMAGAVAAECSKCCSRRVSFYMRKGGECLNKYVGESEKHLQNLFTQAYSTRPSIIFFDEIDGLVPTRSELQEQVHASVVSTLLALMDGLDTKSEVFVIGATNRIDMIDPALRRPGRFDRELYFPLPPLESRLEIFKIHTSNWKNKPNDNLILKLAAECSGYCGADIQSLCSQAVMQSFSRSFPQVRDEDFWDAKEKIVPASQRIYILPSRPLSPELQPLLKRSLEECISEINKSCPFSFMYRNSVEFSKNKSLRCPRFLLIGKEGQAHITHLAPAVLQSFDHLPVVVMDLTTINEDANRISDSGSLVHKIEEARQSMPSITYLRNITSWWNLIDDTAKQVLISSLESLDSSATTKIFIFGTASVECYNDLPPEIKEIFPKKKCFQVTEPVLEERKNFFRHVLVEKNLLPPRSPEGNSSGDVSNITKTSSSSKNKNLGERGKQNMSSRCQVQQFDLKKFDTIKASKLRNGKTFRNTVDDGSISGAKKIKLELDPPGYSACVQSIEKNTKESSHVIIDVCKLEKLIESAVEVTSNAKVSSMVRLYEELEIVSLRYSSKLDRTRLPEVTSQ
ncbi:hypothetical protein RUM43_010751 [Polyplax serrata]|uniref:AAA+ ATPase domain-containing protein n=1 Tax=Polyplax serrata TaxID=468196 RepID=A0AAN8S0Q0_POLSC